MIVFVLEYWVDYEGGGIIGVFATEEDARKVFWAEVANGDICAGDGAFISRREVGKTAGEYNDDYDLVAEFERKFPEWIEVTNDD